MNAITLRIMPRNDYDFSGLGASGEMRVTIAQHIDVSPFRVVDLVVRVHQADIASGASVGVAVYADGFTLEDPAKVFVPPDPAGSVIIDSATARAAPVYRVSALAGRGLGRLVSVVVKGQQADVVGKCAAALSVDLVMKDGDPRSLTRAYNTYRGYR